MLVNTELWKYIDLAFISYYLDKSKSWKNI